MKTTPTETFGYLWYGIWWFLMGALTAALLAFFIAIAALR